MALDRIDIAILETLQKEGRISNAALAEVVGLSQSACSRRLTISRSQASSAAITRDFPMQRSAIR